MASRQVKNKSIGKTSRITAEELHSIAIAALVERELAKKQSEDELARIKKELEDKAVAEEDLKIARVISSLTATAIIAAQNGEYSTSYYYNDLPSERVMEKIGAEFDTFSVSVYYNGGYSIRLRW